MLELTIENPTDFEGRKLYEQFEAFNRQEGLIPSCSICVHKNNELPHFDHLVLIDKIGKIILYHDEDNYYIEYSVSGQEQVIARLTADYRKMDVYYREITGRYLQSKTAVTMYFGYRYLAVSTGNMMIHSAAVLYRNQGIMFCGISGAGKSTQAHLWIRHLQAVMLNADKPCLICRDDKIFVHGTPWSGKENVYINDYAPVKSIVFVEKSPENRVEKLSNVEAFSLLYLNNYIYPVNNELEEKYVEVVEHISGLLPIYRLYCDMSEQAVKVLYEELYREEYVLKE